MKCGAEKCSIPENIPSVDLGKGFGVGPVREFGCKSIIPKLGIESVLGDALELWESCWIWLGKVGKPKEIPESHLRVERELSPVEWLKIQNPCWDQIPQLMSCQGFGIIQL